MRNAHAKKARKETAVEARSEQERTIGQTEQLDNLVTDLAALREYQRKAVAYLATDVYDDANRWMREEPT